MSTRNWTKINLIFLKKIGILDFFGTNGFLMHLKIAIILSCLYGTILECGLLGALNCNACMWQDYTCSFQRTDLEKNICIVPKKLQ